MRRYRAAGWACLGVAGALLLAMVMEPTVSGRLDPRMIEPDTGAGYVVGIHASSLLYKARGDGTARDKSSSLVLLEDGLPLGPASTNHEVIRRLGGGAYSHWGNGLFFSASDGSDPRSNGRRYAYEVRAGLRPALTALGLLAGLSGLFLLAMSRRSTPASPAAPSSRRRAKVAGALLCATGLAFLLVLVLTPWLRSTEAVRLPVSEFAPSHGSAYHGVLSARTAWPWREAEASSWLPLPAEPLLLEDGRPIGWLAASLADIAREGGGRFTYFRNKVALSTADGSDPRTNGRRYELQVPIVPSASSWMWAAAAILAGLALLCGRAVLPFGLALTRFEPRAAPAGGVLSIFAFAAIALLLAQWWRGDSAFLGIASYLPISDAFGYFSCAVTISATDTLSAAQFGTDFCARRVVYPAMLSSLLAVSGGHPSIALVIQAGMIGLGLGVLFLALQRSVGWIAALVTCIGAMSAARFTIGNFMTESLGFAAGATALALLVLAARRAPLPAPPLLVCGLALMSLAQVVRPGAILALPMLGAWAIYATRDLAWPSRWPILVMSLAALAGGFLLQYLLVLALGGDASNTGGNAAVLLYGLSTGSRDWSEAYREFAHLFASGTESEAFRRIGEIAVQNIWSRPEVFARSLMVATADFLRSIFAVGWLDPFNRPLTGLFCAGIVICVVQRRHPLCALLLAVALGELLSAPFFIDSGGQRVLAATLPARLAVAGVGAAWILAAVSQARIPGFPGSAREEPDADRLPRRAAVALAGVLGAIAVLPATPLAGKATGHALPPSNACPSGQLELVTRLDGEVMQLTAEARRLPLADERMGIAMDGLQRDRSWHGAWWHTGLPLLPRQTTLVHAIQLRSDEYGRVVTAVASAPLTAAAGGYVSLCLSPADPRVLKIGDFHYLPIVSSRVRRDLP